MNTLLSYNVLLNRADIKFTKGEPKVRPARPAATDRRGVTHEG
jgi:hypothetical protein